MIKKTIKISGDRFIFQSELFFDSASDKLSNDKYVGILILPPSIKTLKTRLCERKSETSESMNVRVNEAFNVKKIAKYDYVIINNELEKSKQALLNIVIKLLG